MAFTLPSFAAAQTYNNNWRTPKASDFRGLNAVQSTAGLNSMGQIPALNLEAQVNMANRALAEIGGVKRQQIAADNLLAIEELRRKPTLMDKLNAFSSIRGSRKAGTAMNDYFNFKGLNRAGMIQDANILDVPLTPGPVDLGNKPIVPSPGTQVGGGIGAGSGGVGAASELEILLEEYSKKLRDIKPTPASSIGPLEAFGSLPG